MDKDYPIATKLIINGFTINPIKDVKTLSNFLKGLCGYGKKHACDFVDHTIIHTNYLKKQIGEAKIDYVENKKFSGLIAYVLLVNGYFVIKIQNNIYPAEIQFDLYLDEKMLDPYIILDHLSCPALPHDGLGMFDYQYSLSYVTKPRSILSKKSKKVSYVKDINSFQIVLSELEKSSCYFCDTVAENFIFFDTPRKIVLSCKDHLELGTTREYGESIGLKQDLRKAEKFKTIKVVDERGLYTKNIKMDDLDENF